MIEPLRKASLTGEPYARTPDIEAKLAELYGLPRVEVARRSGISNPVDPAYVPIECLVHLVRACRSDNSDQHFGDLYRSLLARVVRKLPRPERRDGKTSSLVAEAIRDDVLGRFIELLAADRTTYMERLDFFEIRFDQALKRLKLTAQEKAWREQGRTVPLEFDGETGEPSPEVERAASARLREIDSSLLEDPDFRLRLDAAIDALPSMQGRIVHMLLQGIQIDSKEKDRVTISTVLGKSEKTVRTHRDAAFASIRRMLDEGDGR